jgi:hypothetical protein
MTTAKPSVMQTPSFPQAAMHPVFRVGSESPYARFRGELVIGPVSTLGALVVLSHVWQLGISDDEHRRIADIGQENLHSLVLYRAAG